MLFFGGGGGGLVVVDLKEILKMSDFVQMKLGYTLFMIGCGGDF